MFNKEASGKYGLEHKKWMPFLYIDSGETRAEKSKPMIECLFNNISSKILLLKYDIQMELQSSNRIDKSMLIQRPDSCFKTKNPFRSSTSEWVFHIIYETNSPLHTMLHHSPILLGLVW